MSARNGQLQLDFRRTLPGLPRLAFPSAACWPLWRAAATASFNLSKLRLGRCPIPRRRRRCRSATLSADRSQPATATRRAIAGRESTARFPPAAAAPPRCECPFPAPRDEWACDPPAASPDAAANRQAAGSTRPNRDSRPRRDAPRGPADDATNRTAADFCRDRANCSLTKASSRAVA